MVTNYLKGYTLLFLAIARIKNLSLNLVSARPSVYFRIPDLVHWYLKKAKQKVNS